MNIKEKDEIKYYEISDKLRKMKLSGMAEAIEELVNDYNLGLRDPFEVVSWIIEKEWELRYRKKFHRYLKQANLKYPNASLDERLNNPVRRIDVRIIEQLSKCEWIDQAKNLTITGKTGTGKTHLICALGVCAIQRFYSVKYIKASTLINDATNAKLDGRITDYVNSIIGYDLLIIDDFGFMSLKNEDCLSLFEILDGRSERKATIISSQLPRETWYDLFNDNTYADACMERLTKGAYKIELFGPSLRG